MTTKITVDAHAGWPVKVIPINSANGIWFSDGDVVPPHKVETFYVWSGRDLLVSEMPPPTFQDRVIAEEKELSDKLNKLGGFIHSEKFSTLDIVDQVLLARQDDHMRVYAEVLRERIARFNKDMQCPASPPS